MSQSLPDNDPIVGEDRKAFRTWMQWLSWAHNIIQTIQQSGPTSERPVNMLWIGRQFYDTTLNKPVYVQAVKPTVWRDAAGTIV